MTEYTLLQLAKDIALGIVVIELLVFGGAWIVARRYARYMTEIE